MSRPRKPDALHDLHGTVPHPSTTREVTVRAARPVMPSTLSPAAKKVWRRLMPLLLERGSLTAADAQALEIHAELFARWQACQRKIVDEGVTQECTVLSSNGEPITRTRPHPALKIAQDCERSLRASLRELGLTPASRTRVMAARPAEDESEGSILDLLSEK